MKAGGDARVAARRIVGRVLRGGAYSNVVVRPETAHLGDADRRLAEHLAFGVLRQLPRLDRALDEVSSRAPETIRPEVRDVLRVGAFELFFSGTPPHAAVDLAVESVRQAGQERAAAFVNGVLRTLARHGEPTLPGGVEGEALTLGHLPWMVLMLTAAWNREEARAFLEASQRAAPVGVRRRPGAAVPPGAERIAGIPDAYQLRQPGTIPVGTTVQDPASVAVGVAVASRPGDRVLDVAAAPGGKTAHLWDLMQGRGLLVANDVQPRRVLRARSRSAEMAVGARWLAADGRRLPFAGGTFDRVLLDAPCTGLGTLRRRPELRYRVTPGEVERLAKLQVALLEEALQVVKPGGIVVYSVCTVSPDETVAVVESLPAAPPPGLPGRRWGKGWLLGPHLTDSDGMFVSVVRREA